MMFTQSTMMLTLLTLFMAFTFVAGASYWQNDKENYDTELEPIELKGDISDYKFGIVDTEDAIGIGNANSMFRNCDIGNIGHIGKIGNICNISDIGNIGHIGNARIVGSGGNIGEVDTIG